MYGWVGGRVGGWGRRAPPTHAPHPHPHPPTPTLPGRLFGPVWTVLYATMGYASWRVMQAGGGALPVGLYFAQLALNFAWTP